MRVCLRQATARFFFLTPFMDNESPSNDIQDLQCFRTSLNPISTRQGRDRLGSGLCGAKPCPTPPLQTWPPLYSRAGVENLDQRPEHGFFVGAFRHDFERGAAGGP